VYPVQWTGALTMLAAQASRALLRQLVALAEGMLDVHQVRLPDPINAALESSVAAYRAEEPDDAREAQLLAHVAAVPAQVHLAELRVGLGHHGVDHRGALVDRVVAALEEKVGERAILAVRAGQ